MDCGKGLKAEELLDLLARLVRFESTTGEEGEISHFLRDYMAGMGLEPHVVEMGEGKDPFYVRIPGREPGSVAFVGHMDVVGVKGQDWKHDPFAACIEGTRMYGRGSSDMKSGLVAMIACAAWLVRNGITPAKSLIFAFTVEEEKGYRGARALADAGCFSDSEMIIIPEPTEGSVYIGQKGQLWVDVDFTGRAAHGALPELGANAAVAASDFAVRMTDAFGSFAQKPYLGKSTGSVDEVHGGWQMNVVPNAAKAGIDFRVVDEADREKALGMVDEACGNVYEMRGVSAVRSIRQYVSPVVSDMNLPIVKKFLLAAGISESEREGLSISPYSTDGSVIFSKIGKPLMICGPGSIKVAHQPEEYLEIGQLFDVADIFIRFAGGAM